MKIIKVNNCYECPYHETEWNRGNQNWDMRCKEFGFYIVSGKAEILYDHPIPNDCGLENA